MQSRTKSFNTVQVLILLALNIRLKLKTNHDKKYF